jgi:tetratricopeptide (TPR) repeat protein
MVNLTKQKNYLGVKDIYDKLEQRYKDNKVVDFIYVRACYHIDQKLYQQALEDYSAKFPGAVGCRLMLADLYYMQKDYEKNIAINNQIDSLIGGDPFMDFMRGGAYRAAGKTAESLSYFEKVYRYDPSIQLNSVVLAKSYAEAGEKDKAKEVLAGYMKTPRYHEGDLDAFFTKNPDLK